MYLDVGSATQVSPRARVWHSSRWENTRVFRDEGNRWSQRRRIAVKARKGQEALSWSPARFDRSLDDRTTFREPGVTDLRYTYPNRITNNVHRVTRAHLVFFKDVAIFATARTRLTCTRSPCAVARHCYLLVTAKYSECPNQRSNTADIVDAVAATRLSSKFEIFVR